ncbi:MAG: dicarboxylate/amino acid:cation symporter [Lachnospiraceae bacterium]|nr:dicarboxylate/amino acid:cation symporter [Lachnospiraceae bacterium]
MYIRKQFEASEQSIGEITSLINKSLQDYGINKSDRIKAVLTAEEAAGSLIAHNGAGDPKDASAGKDLITVTVYAFLGYLTIDLAARGDEYSILHDMSAASLKDMENESQKTELQDTIRNILLASLGEKLKHRHLGGVNYIRMTVVRTKRAFLYQTLGAMAAAVIFGILFSAVLPESVNTGINRILLVPIKTMYMNSLKMIVAPVVFFSIISCIAQFSDLEALGRIGGKIIGMYLFTTFVAVGVGIGIFYLIGPGDASLADSLVTDASSITSQTMDVSILDTVVGIIPTDIISPFLKSNMLQLIFIAVLCGVATGLLGKYSEKLNDLFQACNDLFLKVTSLIIKVMPVAVFCSIMSMVLTMGVKTIITVLSVFGTFILGLICMMCFYLFLMIVPGRMSPLPFVKKYAPTMLQVFSMASSNASIPINMEACEKKLGISKRIFTLSIPLGATLNMDGTCVYLAVFAMALAKTYGVGISRGAMLSMIISIIVLSMGAPGIPGSGLICLSVLLTQMNVPVEAIGIVMGIDSLCGMCRVASNCLGDVAVSTIVAKSEGELDMNVYSG